MALIPSALDGACIRDYIHINDLVSAHRLALDALGPRDKLMYNPGNGAGYYNCQVIEMVCAVTNRTIPVKELARYVCASLRLLAASPKTRCEPGWKY